MKFNCAIVEDEPYAVELLTMHIEKIDELKIVNVSHNAIEALEFLNSNQVDLLFLDIEIPQANGIDLLKMLNPQPKTIITSAYQEYALDGFNLDVIDYLLKPITFPRFLKAILKFKNLNNEHSVRLNNTQDSFIKIYDNKKINKVYLDDILLIESMREYLKFHLKDHVLITKGSLSSYEDSLPDHQFLRIHKSYIVPLKKISAYSNSFVEIGKRKIQIGRTYKTKIFKLLDAQV